MWEFQKENFPHKYQDNELFRTNFQNFTKKIVSAFNNMETVTKLPTLSYQILYLMDNSVVSQSSDQNLTCAQSRCVTYHLSSPGVGGSVTMFWIQTISATVPWITLDRKQQLWRQVVFPWICIYFFTFELQYFSILWW